MTEPIILTVKNFDIWNALVGNPDPSQPGPLVDLVALDTPLPASNILRRSLRLAREAFGDLDAERNKRIEKYAEKDADGKMVKTDDGKGIKLSDPDAFAKEIEELFAQEVPLVGAKTVKVSELGKINFSGDKLERLNAFVVDDV